MASLREQIAERCVEVDRVKQMLDLAFAGGARSSKAPEDRVVFPLLVSCRHIVEEILFAINEGFGRSALRSARTMYECVVTARHLNLHPEKAEDFLSTFHAQWAKIIQSIPFEHRGSPMHDRLIEQVPRYAEGKFVGLRDLDWSGKHVLEMAKESGPLAGLHSVAWDYASAFVHPSAIFVLTTLTRPDPTGSVFEAGARPQEQQARLAAQIAHDLVLSAVDLRLKYTASVKLQELFEKCQQDFLAIWGYPPHI